MSRELQRITGVVFGIIAAALVLAAACVAPSNEDGLPNAVEAFTDPETGCRYFLFSGSGKDIEPRLRADGKPDCPEAAA